MTRMKWQKERRRIIDCPDPKCDKRTAGDGRNELRRNLSNHFQKAHGMSREKAVRLAYAAVPTAQQETS